jgi:hypothetical protein
MNVSVTRTVNQLCYHEGDSQKAPRPRVLPHMLEYISTAMVLDVQKDLCIWGRRGLRVREYGSTTERQ